tara:strand:- start:530 stop:760 length:231 start_codon:yes stop_codon:yes gene_type:complete
MARKKGGSGGDKKGKKEHKNKPTSKKYKFYSVDGDKVSRNAKNCPRCGPGIFLSENSGRSYCGKCHFTEFSKKEAQ